MLDSLDYKIDSCIALDDGAALHYKNGKIHETVSFSKNAYAYEVNLKEGKVHHRTMKGISLI